MMRTKRCSRPLYSSQTTTHPTRPPTPNSASTPMNGQSTRDNHTTPTPHTGAPGQISLLPQNPTACFIHPDHQHHPPQGDTRQSHTSYSTHEQTTRTTLVHEHGQPKVELLRKEVIQPHLPVRLPCYDLVPIASPTFDDSLHKG